MTDEWPSEAQANDDRGLSGKVAIVTGASAEDDGITNGRAAAAVLGRSGTKVVCVGRRDHQVRRTAEMITATGGEANGVVAGVSCEADCEQVVAKALTQAMAVDPAPDGIRVNCIVLGPVYTQTVERMSPRQAGPAQERLPTRHRGDGVGHRQPGRPSCCPSTPGSSLGTAASHGFLPSDDAPSELRAGDDQP